MNFYDPLGEKKLDSASRAEDTHHHDPVSSLLRNPLHVFTNGHLDTYLR